MKKIQSLFYGFGMIPEAMINTIVSLYLLFFATDILGLKSSVAGTVIFLANLFDILSDLFIMNFVDRHPTRFGTYRPWLFLALPMTVCLMLIFWGSGFLHTETGKILWIGCLYFLMVPIFGTSYLCPYLSLRTRMSREPKDQLRLSSSCSVFENIGQLAAAFFAMILVANRSYTDFNNWRNLTVTIICISAVCIIVTFFGTRENYTPIEKKVNFRVGIRALLGNRSFRKVIATLIVVYIPWTMYSSLLTYFCTNNLGHSEWMPIISLSGLAFSALFGVFVPSIVNRLGKKMMIIVSCIMIILSSAVFAFANSLWSMLLFCAIKDFGLMSIYITLFAHVPEIDKSISRTAKLTVTGIMFGIVSALAKIGTAVGNYFSSAVLTLGDYNAKLSVQADKTLLWLRFSIVVTYALAAVIILAINRKGFEE